MSKLFLAMVTGFVLLCSGSALAKSSYICNATAVGIQYVKATVGADGKWVTLGYFNVESDKCSGFEYEGDAYIYAKNDNNTQYWGYSGVGDKDFCTSNSTTPIVDADKPCTDPSASQMKPYRKIVTSETPGLNAVILGNLNSMRLFKYCNQFAEKIWVSLGYEEARGITTKGWWTVEPSVCNQAWVPFQAESVFLAAITAGQTYQWNGNPTNAFVMCIDEKKGYFMPEADKAVCRGADQKLKAFLKANGKEVFNFSAENAAVRP